jgi:hypothetical protein
LKISTLIYVKQSGEFMGRECLGLRSLQGEKAQQISLSNSIVLDDESFHDMIADPDDELCVVKIFKLLRGHYPTDWPGTILRRQIPKKYARRIKPGPDGFIPMVDLSDRGLFGKSYTTEVSHRVATQIKLDCPAGKRHTSASRRRSGITQLVSAPVKVPAYLEVQQASWHKSAGMSARYQAVNEGSHAKQYHAMLVPHPIKKKTRKKEKKANPTMAYQQMPDPMMAQQHMMFGGATDATMHPMACNPMMMGLPNQMMGMPNQMMMGLPNQMMVMPN